MNSLNSQLCLKKDKIDIYYTTSSLGAVPYNFIYDFFTAIFPNFHKPSKNYMEENKQKIIESFHLIYPTEVYVNLSYEGNEETPFFFKEEYYDSFRFEKKILTAYEGKDKYEGDNCIMSHVKFFCTFINY